jgi:Uma2 family endonuclease
MHRTIAAPKTTYSLLPTSLTIKVRLATESLNGAASMATTILTQPPPPPAPLASPAVYRMTVHEFERIADSLENDHVELLDGYLVWSDGMTPPRVLTTERLRRRLDRMIPTGCFVREEKPIRIPDFDEPRPDLAVVRGDPELYRTRHPGPADVVLRIEVSDSSLDRDQGMKWFNYARGGIPVYGIVNLLHRQVEIYTGPGPNGYHSSEILKQGDEIPMFIDGVEIGRIAVEDILH